LAAVDPPFQGFCRVFPMVPVFGILFAIAYLLSLTNPKPTTTTPSSSGSASAVSKKGRTKKID